MDLSKYASRDCNGSRLGDTAATMAASTASTSATALVAVADVGSCDKAVASFQSIWMAAEADYRISRWEVGAFASVYRVCFKDGSISEETKTLLF